MSKIDIHDIRTAFPILEQSINGYPLVYLDNGATTQKPQCVVSAIDEYYHTINSNVHRGIHTLSQRATDAMEQSREKVRHFINSPESATVIFTKGTTDSINTVASGYGQILQKGDEVIVSTMEHHSNIVPWQMACQRSGATLRVIPMDGNGVLDMEAYREMLSSSRTKMVAVAYVSNVLGTVNPVKEIARLAHEVGAKVLIDGAQSTPHMK
ncbi:MAG: aminotransferase class V-fold PLP-dependent enzyme, partial [Flavobacteriales bacterium]|nr:aminotransferase class V-fold PLP-dependent enzyme [Flavobacteriales bacterium]